MPKKITIRCVRPQCMAIYKEDYKSRFCECGALVQKVEFEEPQKKNPQKKLSGGSNPKNQIQNKKDDIKKEELNKKDIVSESLADEVEQTESEKIRTEMILKDDIDGEEIETLVEELCPESEEPMIDFFAMDETPKKGKDAYIYLLLDDDNEVEYKLSKRILIGRTTENEEVDVDLTQYPNANQISRKHALIEQREDGYYITKISKSHSLHVNEKAVDTDEEIRLVSGDMIIFSRVMAFQFEEVE